MGSIRLIYRFSTQGNTYRVLQNLALQGSTTPIEGSINNIVYVVSDPLNLGVHFVCLRVAEYVMFFFFLLFAVVVLWAASGVDGGRPALGDQGDVPPTVFVAAMRLWPPFLPLGVSLT